MTQKQARLVPKPTLQWSEVGGEVLILDREAGELLRLNPAASFIWKEITACKEPREIAEALCRNFALGKARALWDLRRFLNSAKKLELVKKA